MTPEEKKKAEEIIRNLRENNDAEKIIKVIVGDKNLKKQYEKEIKEYKRNKKSGVKTLRGLSSDDGYTRFNVYLSVDLDEKLERELAEISGRGASLNKSIIINLALHYYLDLLEYKSKDAIKDAINMGYLVEIDS